MATKQKSGLYRTKVKIGASPDGKDIVKWVSGRTRKELEDAKREVVERYILGRESMPDRLFGEYAVEWFRVSKAPMLSASSIESYRTALNRDILPELGDRNLRAISALDLQTLINRYAGMSATKITVVFAALKGIFDAACADHILAGNPMEHVRKPKAAPPEEKTALSPEQRKRIEQFCAEDSSAVYLALMYYAGLRPGEARGLQWGDIDWTRKAIHVQRDVDDKAHGKIGSVKTRKSNRIVPMPDALCAVLGGLRGLPDVFVARGEKGGTLAKTSAQRLWTRLMLSCGLVEPVTGTCYAESDVRSKWKPLITPHAIRHNYATMCWESGLDAYTTMRLMGHASIKTTMDIYTHLNDRQLDAISAKVAAIFEKEKPVNDSGSQKTV